jgi:hypothetical protein
MVRSTILVALVLLVLIQSVFVESWWWRRRRRRNCSYPKPTQGNSICMFINFIIEFSFYQFSPISLFMSFHAILSSPPKFFINLVATWAGHSGGGAVEGSLGGDSGGLPRPLVLPPLSNLSNTLHLRPKIVVGFGAVRIYALMPSTSERRLILHLIIP